MYNLKAFREQVKELLHSAYLPDGERATQNNLAAHVYLSVAELSKRLNGARGARLSVDNVHDILRCLARWGAIHTEAELRQMLNLVECPDFPASEYGSEPLKGLKPLPERAWKRLVYPNHNLPLNQSSFVGREAELIACGALLSDTRLLTITGAGGVGKTRLAVEIADNLLDRYPDGAYLVRLDAISDATLMPQEVAFTLGCREEAGRPLRDTLASYLGTKLVLIVLDNCEHLVAAVAQLCDLLLSRCPNLALLATSREALLVKGEVSWPLVPLTLPTPADERDLSRLNGKEAVRLFVNRATEVLPGWQLNSDTAHWVADICRRSDGLPLAIELAAVRVRTMGVGDIAARLNRFFQQLPTGSRAQPTRQETLRASIEWSWSLLNLVEQRLLRRLAVFAPGWQLAATEVVAGDNLEGDSTSVDLLGQLVQKSLVVAELEGEAMRYRLLENIRQYAEEQLMSAGEAEGARRLHLDYYLALAVEAESQLRGGTQERWLVRLEREHSNLRLAYDYALSLAPDLAVKLAAALGRFWVAHGYLSEAQTTLERALRASSGLEMRAKALNWLGQVMRMQGDLRNSIQFHDEALRLARPSGPNPEQATALYNQGLIRYSQGDFSAAGATFEEMVSIARALDDQILVASGLHGRGLVASATGDYAGARTLYGEALRLRREQGDKLLVVESLTLLGLLYYFEGDYATSHRYTEESLSLSEAVTSKPGMIISLTQLGRLACVVADYPTARHRFGEALALARATATRWAIAYNLGGLGLVAFLSADNPSCCHYYRDALRLNRELGNDWACAEQLIGFAGGWAGTGHAREAAAFVGTGMALLAAKGGHLYPMERTGYEQTMALLRTALAEEALTDALSQGEATPLTEAVARALGE